MTLGLVFWILMLLWLVFGFLQLRPAPGGAWNYPLVGGNVLLCVLLLLLGWHSFGAPIRG
jgi:hypothetical protein